MITAGRIGRPHGLDGSFHVNHAQPNLLQVGARVVVDDRETEIVSRKGTDVRPILRLSIAPDRSGVEALRGRELLVAEGDVADLGEDEFWAKDLEGCRVVDGDRQLGIVQRMIALPSCEALELDTGLLVPLVRDAVRDVDIDGKTIDVDAEFLGAT